MAALTQPSPLPHTRAVLDQGLERGLHQAAQLFVAHPRHGSFELCLGHDAAQRPITPESRMRWMSAGKPLSALAVAQLVHCRQLDLDQPVAHWIPEFGANNKGAITPAHLLTHTGGFRSADLNWNRGSWAADLAAVCAAPLEPRWIPGQKAGYHALSSWFILAELVQRIRSNPFPDILQRDLLTPLGMHRTTLVDHETLPSPVPLRLTEPAPPRPHPVWTRPDIQHRLIPGASASGPVRDLARLYKALLGQIPPPPHLSPGAIAHFVGRRRIGMFDHTFKSHIDWGLGFLINSAHLNPEPHPYSFGPFASPNTFGHAGNQCSCAFADPAHGLVVAWAVDGMPGEAAHQPRHRALNEAIYTDLGLGFP